MKKRSCPIARLDGEPENKFHMIHDSSFVDRLGSGDTMGCPACRKASNWQVVEKLPRIAARTFGQGTSNRPLQRTRAWGILNSVFVFAVGEMAQKLSCRTCAGGSLGLQDACGHAVRRDAAHARACAPRYTFQGFALRGHCRTCVPEGAKSGNTEGCRRAHTRGRLLEPMTVPPFTGARV